MLLLVVAEIGIKQKEAMSKPAVVYVSKPEVKEVYSRSESTGRIQAKYKCKSKQLQ